MSGCFTLWKFTILTVLVMTEIEAQLGNDAVRIGGDNSFAFEKSISNEKTNWQEKEKTILDTFFAAPKNSLLIDWFKNNDNSDKDLEGPVISTPKILMRRCRPSSKGLIERNIFPDVYEWQNKKKSEMPPNRLQRKTSNDCHCTETSHFKVIFSPMKNVFQTLDNLFCFPTHFILKRNNLSNSTKKTMYNDINGQGKITTSNAYGMNRTARVMAVRVADDVDPTKKESTFNECDLSTTSRAMAINNPTKGGKSLGCHLNSTPQTRSFTKQDAYHSAKASTTLTPKPSNTSECSIILPIHENFLLDNILSDEDYNTTIALKLKNNLSGKCASTPLFDMILIDVPNELNPEKTAPMSKAMVLSHSSSEASIIGNIKKSFHRDEKSIQMIEKPKKEKWKMFLQLHRWDPWNFTATTSVSNTYEGTFNEVTKKR